MLSIAMALVLGLACGDKDGDDTATTDGGAADGGGEETDGGGEETDGGGEETDGGGEETDGGGEETDGGGEETDGGSTWEMPIDWSPDGIIWLVDLSEAHWVQPTGFGPAFAKNFDQPMMLQVLEAGTVLDLRMGWAVGSGAHQDQCQATTDVLATWLGTAPIFSSERVAFEAPIQGGTAHVPFTRTFVTATFGAEGEALKTVNFEGQWDMREWGAGDVGPDVVGTSDPAELCTALSGFGVACEACASDGVEYCVDVEFEVEKAVISSLTQVEVTEADVAADKRCE